MNIIKIDINDYIDDSSTLLEDVLTKVKNTDVIDYVHSKNESKPIMIKYVYYGEDYLKGGPMIKNYSGISDINIADKIVCDIVKFIRLNVPKLSFATFNDVFNFESKRWSYFSSLTINLYHNLYNKCIKPLYGDIPIIDYEPKMVEEINRYACSLNYNKSVKVKIYAIVRKLLNYAKDYEILPAYIDTKMPVKKRGHSNYFYFTDEQLYLFFEYVKNSKYRYVYALSFITAIPISCLICLKKKDLEEESGSVYLRRKVKEDRTVKNPNDRFAEGHIRLRVMHPNKEIFKYLIDIANMSNNEYVLGNEHLIGEYKKIMKTFDLFKRKYNLEKSGYKMLTNASERLQIEKGINEVDFSFCYGYRLDSLLFDKFRCLGRKSKIERKYQNDYLKYINGIKQLELKI